jgi:RNA polymerase sigma-70 factor (ECF subfamily)
LLREVDPDDCAIVELSLQGYSAEEVGAQLGRAERTVRRVRELTKRRLRRMQEHDLHDRVG